MTGKELYEVWQRAMRECGIDASDPSYDDMEQEEQAAWDMTAAHATDTMGGES